MSTPVAAHGITGALRVAELLATGDRMASLRWDAAEIGRLLVGLARALWPEIEVLPALDGTAVDAA